MKSCVLVQPGLVEIRDVDSPEPGQGEIVVRIRAALTCGTDLKMYRRGHPLIPLPSPFGHEFSGVVSAVGPEVEGFREGDAVMAVHTAPCGCCSDCRDDRPHLCHTLMDTKVLGAFADELLLPRRLVSTNVFKKPADLPFTEAALLEPLSCVVHGVDTLGVQKGQTVAVIGAGPIGLLHVAYLKHLGLRVLVTGRREDRMRVARNFGADMVLHGGGPWVQELREASGRGGPDHVFECTGEADVWEGALWVPRRGGTVTLFGGLPEGTQVMMDARRVHYDALTIRGVFHFTPDNVRRAYELLVSGRLKLAELITAEFPLYQIDAVFNRLMRGEGIKYALIP